MCTLIQTLNFEKVFLETVFCYLIFYPHCEKKNLLQTVHLIHTGTSMYNMIIPAISAYFFIQLNDKNFIVIRMCF